MRKLLGEESEQEPEEAEEQDQPPASVLHSRRQALVPPKLITDDYESASECDAEHSSSGRQSSHL